MSSAATTQEDQGRPNNPVPAPILKGRSAKRVGLFNVGASGVEPHRFYRGATRRHKRTEVCRRWRSNACITSGDGQVSRMIKALLIRVIRGQILIFGERTQGRDWRATLRGCHTSDWTCSNHRCKRRSVVLLWSCRLRHGTLHSPKTAYRPHPDSESL